METNKIINHLTLNYFVFDHGRFWPVTMTFPNETSLQEHLRRFRNHLYNVKRKGSKRYITFIHKYMDRIKVEKSIKMFNG